MLGHVALEFRGGSMTIQPGILLVWVATDPNEVGGDWDGTRYRVLSTCDYAGCDMIAMTGFHRHSVTNFKDLKGFHPDLGDPVTKLWAEAHNISPQTR